MGFVLQGFDGLSYVLKINLVELQFFFISFGIGVRLLRGFQCIWLFIYLFIYMFNILSQIFVFIFLLVIGI